METLLVTVVGQRGRLDLEVPAHVPVRELLPALLRLVGEPAGGPGPAALVAHTGRPLPERASLADSGTLEGALLWLARAHERPARGTGRIAAAHVTSHADAGSPPGHPER